MSWATECGAGRAGNTLPTRVHLCVCQGAIKYPPTVLGVSSGRVSLMDYVPSPISFAFPLTSGQGWKGERVGMVTVTRVEE